MLTKFFYFTGTAQKIRTKDKNQRHTSVLRRFGREIQTDSDALSAHD